jgi:hypothetical protein
MKEQQKSSEFSHFILTRFNQGVYDRKDSAKWMTDRLKLFEKTKKSVLSQSGKFQWVIAFDDRTPEEVIEKVCSDPRMISTHRDVRDYFEGVKIDTDFVITSRLDNDDIYLPGAVLAIQKAFQPQVYVIDMEYLQHDIIKDEKYTSGNKLKKEKTRIQNNGPFLSLCEPSDYVRTCYCRPHNLLLDGYPSADGKVKIPSTKIEIYALMVIHSKNMMNKITGYKV